MITLDSASGYIDIPKVDSYKDLMDQIKQVLQIDDELFNYLYFSYIDPEEQERTRLIPQVYDDFINQNSPKLSIGFLDNLSENILDELKDVIDKNKKRFMEEKFKEENKIEIKKEDENIIEIKKEDENKIEIKKEDENIIEIKKEEENDESKSDILAPYNSFEESSKNNLNKEIQFQNEIYSIDSKAEKLNKLYELKNESSNNEINNENNENNNNEKKEIEGNNNSDKDIIIISKKNNSNEENCSDDDNEIKIKKMESDNNFFLFPQESNPNNNDNISNKIINENKININENENDIFDSTYNLKVFGDNLEKSIKKSYNEEFDKDKDEKKELENNIQNIIESNIDDIKNDVLNSVISEISKSKLIIKNPKDKVIHDEIQCKGCGMVPIIGIRYKCAECENFNYCQKCEEMGRHPHLFYKIKKNNILLN